MSRYDKQIDETKDCFDHVTRTDRTNNFDRVRQLNESLAKLPPGPNTYFGVASGVDDGQLYYNEKWVAQRLGLSVKTIQSWRDKGIGPPFRKFYAAVRYALADIEAFEQAARRTSTSDQGEGGSNA